MRIKFRNIFVGRDKELQELKDLWEDTIVSDYEHKAYVIFNSPGVGKSTLVKKFGKMVESGNIELDEVKYTKGLHFHYVCGTDIKTREDLLKSIIEQILDLIRKNRVFINKYIETGDEEDQKIAKNIFANIIKDANKYVTSNPTMGSICILLQALSGLIPIFFSSDEVQNFEQIILPEEGNYPEESMFHYYTRFLKAFLNHRILLVMTGTQYHMLRHIGNKIGSPLKGKVEPLVISPFSTNDVDDYMDEIIKLTEDVNPKLLQNLRSYLHTFSGGHARTIEKITKEVLTRTNDYVKYSYVEFVEILTEKTNEILTDSILNTEKTTELQHLQSRELFQIVHEWYIQGVYNKLNLGSKPITENYSEKIPLRDIVYTLMTIGVLIENGNRDYHITSYFHYLAYLQTIIGEYEAFLLEIMNNKFFRSIVGSHAGFGYTFERIFLTALIVNSNKIKDFPIQANQIVQIQKQVDYSSLELKNGLIIHTPDTKNIDAIIISNRLVVLQLTTMKDVPQTKLNKFVEELQIIHKATEKDVEGWFVSLFTCKLHVPENIKLVQGDDFKRILGNEIYKRLIETKLRLIE